MDEPRPDVRIGDRERREVDARLQQAYADGVLTLTEYEERSGRCWAARTRAELAPLTADLPDPEPGPAAPAEPTGAVAKEPAAAAPAKPHGRKLGSALAGVVLVGAGLFAAGQGVFADDGFSAFGGRTVTVAPGVDRVEVGFVFGGTRVIVPADARVQTEGIVLFGGTRCGTACDGSGTRDVVVDATGAFGGLTIQRVGESEQDLDGADDRNDGDAEDAEDAEDNNNDNDNDGGDDDED